MPIKTNSRDILYYFDWSILGDKQKDQPEKIIDAQKQNENDIQKHFSKHFQGWSYDLCLGEEVYITSESVPRKLSDSNPYVTIKPGEFALLITYEKLDLPSYIMAFISVKFTYKKKGLVNISGFHVDPNYKGKIIFSVYNAGPSDILLKYKEPVFMIFFEQLEDRSESDSEIMCENCVVHQIKSRCRKCLDPIPGHDNIPVSMVSEIKGQSGTLANNQQRIESLENAMKLYGGIAIGLVLTLLGIILKMVIK